MSKTISTLKSKLLGASVNYKTYDGDYDVPIQSGHIINIEEFIYDGSLKGYSIRFDNTKISKYLLKVEKVPNVLTELEKSKCIVLTPSYFESYGTSKWTITTQN